MYIKCNNATYWVGAAFKYHPPPKSALKTPDAMKKYIQKQLEHDEDRMLVSDCALTAVMFSLDYAALFAFAVGLAAGEDTHLSCNEAL